MSYTIKNKISFIVCISLCFILLVCQIQTIKKKDKENPYPIAWDVYGYYLYLPATFIYNDLGLQNNDWINKTREKYNPSPSFYQVTSGKENKKVIIYNVGYSFVFAPGFFVANSLAPLLGKDADGFSKPYQMALLITAFLFSIIGIIMLRKILLTFFSDSTVAFTMIAIVLGTNYFFQAAYDGVMPHNILFTINCFIIWHTIVWHQKKQMKDILLLAFFIGLATICRPTELIWILVPLLWNVVDKASFIEKAKMLFQQFSQLIFAGALLVGIILIQFCYLKYATGYFRVFNLHSETFSFLSPYTIEFLFSYKKGWLLYTPIMIFSIIGFWYIYKKSKNIFAPLFLFFIINLYVISSWECWWYAASFSQRPMVESYCLMAIPMGFFIDSLVTYKYRWIRYFIALVFLSFILLNQFQIWQYRNNIIDGERMTKSYYWKVFGSTENKEENKKYLSIDRSQTVFNDVKNYYKKEVFDSSFEDSLNLKSVDFIAVTGKRCLLVNSEAPFYPVFEEKYSDITSKSHVWVRASVWVYLTAPSTESNSALIITTESKGKAYKYLSTDYNNFNIKPFEWKQINIEFLSPEIRHSDDVLKVYFWNMGSKNVLIDDFKVAVFEPKRENL